MRLCILIAALLLAPGCGILEELDSGTAAMEHNSPRSKGKAKSGQKTAKAGEPEKKKTGWENIQSFSPGESTGSLVRCALPTGTQYMDRNACLARGGRASS